MCGDWVRVERDGEGRGRREKAGEKKENEIKHCLSPELCVINVKLLSLSPPLLPAPLSQSASTLDRSS